MKTKMTMLWMVTLALFTVTKAQAQQGDLSVVHAIISRVDGNAVTINYTLRNVGTASINLGALAIQTHVSTDEALSNNDVLIGGSHFPNPIPLLTPGQQYSGSLVVNSTISLNQYPYLLFYVIKRAGYPNQETNFGNNKRVFDVTARFPDLAIKNVDIISINGNDITIRYTIKNEGATPLHFSKFDRHTGFSALPNGGGGSTYIEGGNFPGAPAVLNSGVSYTGTWSFTAPVSLQDNPHLNFFVAQNGTGLEYERDLLNDFYQLNLRAFYSDLVVKDIAVIDVNGYNVTYSYIVRNEGSQPLYLERFYFQTYLSGNNVLDPDDLPAGSADFTVGTIRLAQGEAYSGQFTSNAQWSLQARKFLVFDVRPFSARPNPQHTLSNDRLVKDLSPSFADLEVLDINITEADADSIHFNYVIRNAGVDTLHLNQYYYACNMSMDQIYDNADKYAGSATFSQTPLILLPGQIHSGQGSAYLTVSAASYPYFIFIGYRAGIDPERTFSNNTFVKFVPPSSSRLEAYHLETAQDLLTVENATAKKQATSYVLYTLPGETIGEGTFEEKAQINTSAFRNGLYLIKLSDGNTSETLRFVVQN